MSVFSATHWINVFFEKIDRWCLRTGRKLTICNTKNGEPTLIRYSLFPTKSSPNAPSREPRWGNVYLHKFLRSEEFDLHDHPWPFVSLLLKGRYRENLPHHQKRMRCAGSLRYFPAEWTHSVELFPGETCWTLVARGTHQRQWGYHTASGWIPARTYLTQVHKTGIERVNRPPYHTSGPIIDDQWKTRPQRLLLVGNDGLIGPHMAEHLMDYHPDTELFILGGGTDVARIQDSCRFQRQFDAQKVHFLSTDVRDHDSLYKATKNVDTVIYLDGHKPYLNNVHDIVDQSSTILKTLEAFSLLGAKQFALVSSSEVHGPANGRKAFHPHERTYPISLHRAALIGSEALVQAWSQEHDGTFVIVRTPDIFGERTPLDRTIGRFLRQLIKKEPIYLRTRKHSYGQRTKSSHQYIHARDAARAILHATMNGHSGSVYHLSGKELADDDLIEHLSRMTGLHPKIGWEDAVQREDGYRFAIQETLGKELHWKPPHGFEISIRNTVDWMLRERNQRWLLGVES